MFITVSGNPNRTNHTYPTNPILLSTVVNLSTYSAYMPFCDRPRLSHSFYSSDHVDINVTHRLRTSTHGNESIMAVARLLDAF